MCFIFHFDLFIYLFLYFWNNRKEARKQEEPKDHSSGPGRAEGQEGDAGASEVGHDHQETKGCV